MDRCGAVLRAGMGTRKLESFRPVLFTRGGKNNGKRPKQVDETKANLQDMTISEKDVKRMSNLWLDISTVKPIPMEIPHDGKMLITDGKAVSVGRLVGNTWSVFGLSMGKITHWMPLPNPPD